MSRTQVFALAWPIVISNLSTPLLGLVDTAVIGNLGEASLIGAVAVGGLIFSFLFWGFGFLRMGTTGLVAQAVGSDNTLEVRASFYRAVLIGMLIGLALVLFQIPIADLTFNIIEGSRQVETSALTYFQIRIWGAPFNLAHLAVLGFLLGTQNTKAMLWIQLLLNGTNILLDIVFVVFLNWGVAGVALATVIAEILAFTVGITVAFRILRKNHGGLLVAIAALFNWAALKKMAQVNRDLTIRTLCLLFAFAWFTNQGAKSGDVILATNAILMQFVTFSAFFLDGFALASESLVGASIGAGNRKNLNFSIRYSFEWALLMSVLLSLGFMLFTKPVIASLTNVEAVILAADRYAPWAIAAPLVSFACFILDGIFIGATRTVEMRNAMLISVCLYLISFRYLSAEFGNHGLWASLMAYFLFRAMTLAYYLPRITRSAAD